MKHVKLFEQFIAESVDLVHVYDKDGEMYGTGELVKTKGKKSLIRWDGSNEEWIDSDLVKMVESTVFEKREDVGKYNTVKKVIAKLGRRPSEQDLASFINDNYYDVTEVERGDDDPSANDKIADLVAFYKFDIDDWEIAWADAQNESVVTESKNSKEIKELEELLKSIKSNTPAAQGRKAAIQDDIERLKNESVVTEGYGEFIKAKNLTDIVNLSKENKRAVFYVTDDNNSRIGTFYLKNGKFAKVTSANPNYDLKNNKTSLRDRSDVIYKYKVDESVVTESFRVGKVLAVKKYNAKTNRKEVVDVRVTDYIKKPGSKDFVEYDFKGKKRKVSVDVFKSMIAEDAVNVTPESDVTIDNYTTDGNEEILSVEIVGAIVSSESEDEFLQYFYDTYGEGAFTKTDTATLAKYYNEYVEEVTAKETEEEEEAEKAEGGDDELDMDI